MAEKSPSTLEKLLSECARLTQMARLYERHPPRDAHRRALLSRSLTYVELAVKDLTSGLKGAAPNVQKDRKLANSISKLRRPSARSKPARRRREFQGKSTMISIRDLLSILELQEKTGLLRIKHGNQITTLHFYRGEVIEAVNSRTPIEFRLSEILVDSNVIERSELDAFTAGKNPVARGFGRAIVLKGLVSEKEMIAARTERLRRHIQRTLDAETSNFSFLDGHVEQSESPVRLNITRAFSEEGAEEAEEPAKAAPVGSDKTRGSDFDFVRAQLDALQSADLDGGDGKPKGEMKLARSKRQQRKTG